jgi:hypothetical protein
MGMDMDMGMGMCVCWAYFRRLMCCSPIRARSLIFMFCIGVEGKVEEGGLPWTGWRPVDTPAGDRR